MWAWLQGRLLDLDKAREFAGEPGQQFYDVSLNLVQQWITGRCYAEVKYVCPATAVSLVWSGPVSYVYKCI